MPEISPELEARIKTLRETGETKAVKDAERFDVTTGAREQDA